MLEALEVENTEEPQEKPRGLTTPEMFQLAFRGENMAEHMGPDELARLGERCWEGYSKDKQSQQKWSDDMSKAAELAMQVAEVKSTPWENASNVKLPITTVGALQFASRAFPAVVKEPEPVKGKVNGQPTQKKLRRAKRIGKHMSYQLMEQMEGWVEDMDTLLHILPIYGCAYKKTYESDGRHSDLVRPEALVFDYYAKSVEKARRKTEVFFMHRQEIIEKQRTGDYLEFDLAEGPSNPEVDPSKDKIQKLEQPGGDENTPFVVCEQHTFYDMDGDGYDEPWIVTFLEHDKRVVKISPRFDKSGVKPTRTGSFIIEPIEYYTEYKLLPDPSGGVRGLGWGHILFPLNDTINSITNQLVDAGTLANQQGGMIDERLAKKFPSGPLKIKMNEWVKVNGAAFQDIKNGLLPWPTKAPSTVLFQLLGMLTSWAQKLTTVTDTMAGENPPVNQPASTTLELLNQGQKVFAGIHKRLFRSFNMELRKIKRLNRLYLQPEEYFTIIDAKPEDIQPNVVGVEDQGEVMPGMGRAMVILRTDYDGDDTDVSPSADPSVQTEAQMRARSMAILQGLQQGMPFNPMEAAKWYLDAFDIPEEDQKRLIVDPQSKPPDPKVQVEMLKQKGEERWVAMEGQTRTIKAQMEAQQTAHKQQMDVLTRQLEAMRHELERGKFEWQKKKDKAEILVKAKQASRDKT